jgi:hypothetical protein
VHGLNEEQAVLLHDVGVRIIRKTMYWNTIETTTEAGKYDEKALAAWDETVKLCARHGITLLVIVHGNPPGVNFEHRQDGYVRFAHFMTDMARRYPTVRYWELWNEMDVGFTDLFGAGKDVAPLERGKMYAEMLKLAYPAIRAANPEAWILTGGIAEPWGDFTRGIYEGGGREFFDIMNVHTYGVPLWGSFLGRGMACRAIMTRYGDADKPMWNTEFGIDAGNMVQAWGYPHDRQPAVDDAKFFDDEMIREYKDCLDGARKYGLYQKVLAYQFVAGNECKPAGIEEKVRLPKGMTLDDYGYGWLRKDGKTPRPLYEWIKKLNFNAPLVSEPSREVTVGYGLPGWKPKGFPVDSMDMFETIKGVHLDGMYPTAIPLEASK